MRFAFAVELVGAVIPARAGVHGGDKYEICRVCCAKIGVRKSNLPFFQGLSKGFEYCSGKFWKLVKE
jgi:hypothetical protein